MSRTNLGQVVAVNGTGIDPALAAHFDAPPSDGYATGSAPAISEDGRVEVKYGNDLHRVLEELTVGLTSDRMVFQRAHELVTVVGADTDVGAELAARLAAGTPVIRPLNAHSLRPRLTRHVRFLRTVKPTAKERTAAACMGEEPPIKWGESLPSGDLVRELLALPGWRGIPPLAGILEAPSVRPDGTVIDQPGYDAATGFFYVPSQVFDTVDPNPSQTDAMRALAALTDAFIDFPFVSEPARYVPIAAVLSLLARPAIEGAVPAFLFDASTPGSGKSLCADVACMIATGRAAPRGTFPVQREELEKVLSSYAVAGAAVVGFDNIESFFGGAALDKYLAAHDTVDLRVLGQTQKLTMAWRAAVLASGNNVAVMGDTQRRVLISRLEPTTDRPEDRDGFKHFPLLPWVRDNRARLVAAALTILRAHVHASRPACGVRLMGTFEEWTRVVAHAIVFAGGANVLDARPSAEIGDSGERAAVVALMSGLKRLDVDRAGLTVRELLKLLYPKSRPPRAEDGPPDGYDELREAIETIARPKAGMMPDAGRVGVELRRWRARFIGAQRLVSRSAGGGIARWHVED